METKFVLHLRGKKEVRRKITRSKTLGHISVGNVNVNITQNKEEEEEDRNERQ